MAGYLPADYYDDDDDFDYSSNLHDNVRKTTENMKITIVPDITSNAGLNGQKFDGSLDEEEKQSFQLIQQTFGMCKRSPTLTKQIQTFYISCSNPYLYALKLFANCSDISSQKSQSLPITLLEELETFKKKYNLQTQDFVDDNLKMVAFNLIKGQSKLANIRMVVNLYNLIGSKRIFIDKIQEIIDRKQYKEACQLACELELHEQFTMFETVFPLILQDKLTIVEEYLMKAVHLQRPLVELLDSLLKKPGSVSIFCSDYIEKYNYTDVRFSNLHTKTMTKLVTRFAKMYNLGPEITPNLIRIKSYGTLQYLIHKRFVEKNALNKESWLEMVKETVAKDASNLHDDLIDSCVYYDDLCEAAYWVEYFEVSIDKLPTNVREYLKDRKPSVIGSNQCDPTDCQIIETRNDEILQLQIPSSNIVYVLERNQFNKMLKYLSVQNMLGMDAEWKPTFCTTNGVALIQLATKDRIYLIDVMQLNVDVNDWNQLARCVFNNNEILKIGFSLASDLTMLQKTIPTLNLSSLSLSSYLDLQDLWRKLMTIERFQFPYQSTGQGSALHNLVELCFNKRLDKSNQFSNWEKRPLRADQINYAALDAYVLLDIYDVIEVQVNKLRLDFNELINKFLMENKMKITRKSGQQSNLIGGKNMQNQLRPSRPVDKSEPIQMETKNADSIKFVCDVMLEGLAKSLRKYGIDTASLMNGDNRDMCIKLSQQENRYILTAGRFYNKCVDYVGQKYCYQVPVGTIKDQLTHVLNHFNIDIKHENIFSRCTMCNCNEFLAIDQKNVKRLRRFYGTVDGPENYHNAVAGGSGMRHQKIDTNNRTWKLNNYSVENNQHSLLTSKGVQMKLNVIPKAIVDTVEQFNVCEGCGQCYWDGGHYKRTINSTMNLSKP